MTYSNISKHSGAVSSTEELPIHYDVYAPKGYGDRQFPVVLFLHGFKGFKDWGAFPDACAAIAEAGFVVVPINFSLNGVGESMTEFDQLDLFARETLSQDLDDVGAVISALNNGTITSGNTSFDAENIGILGHSRGGHTAVAAAAEYDEVACLVTWSAVSNYNDRWSDQMVKDWEEKGVTEIKNGRTGQIMPVKDVVYKDAQENADRLMAVKRARELTIPALFIHSKGDEAVPYSEAENLYQNCASAQKEIKLMPNSGHTFGTAHPFKDQEFPETFDQVVQKTTAWFQDSLQ